jgi:hypothetical protein
VGLYDRAVEVLLDTWNIKGHEALNVKEAVPQLACLAFELLRQGKQTATEREILTILEEGRITLPMVGRYAKDSPHDFLKRVELRSSLMLEGGHTSENGKPVPFYQFRHLTFQEYLAAVAAVDGYTLSSERGASPLSVLGENLVSDEWKEVIPMAAVLARMQAEPLLKALVAAAEAEKKNLLESTQSDFDGISTDGQLPPATGRIAQSMVEEAIFLPETLSKAAHLVALFADGCRTGDNWQALSRGPYGPELRSAALEIYAVQPYARRALARNTVALLEAHAESSEFWISEGCEATLLSRLKSSDLESLTRSALSIAGSFWLHRSRASLARSQRVYDVLETVLFDERRPLQLAAAWSWVFWRYLQVELGRDRPIPSNDTLVRLVELIFDESGESDEAIGLTVPNLIGVKRGQCVMTLTPAKEAILRRLVASTFQNDLRGSDLRVAVARIAFILDGVFSDAEIVDYLARNYTPDDEDLCRDIYDFLGVTPVRRKRALRNQKRRAAAD